MRAVAHAAPLAMLLGCGRIAFDSLATQPDAACTPQPFGPPTRVDEISTPSSEVSPSLSKDGLALAFASNRPGGAGMTDLYVATRATSGAPFELVRNVAELNTAEPEFGAALSADGLTLYFGRGSIGVLFVAERADREASFGAPVMVAAGTTEYADLTGAEISSTGLELMFTALTMPTSKRDIYLMSRPDVTAPFGPARRLDELDPLPSGFPTLSPDGLELIFTSNSELWRTMRPAIGGRFAPPELAAELNSTDHDDDAELVGQTLVYLMTQRAGTSDIFTATRECL